MSGQERPFIFVLAGVNGAGKSSIGGHLLSAGGLAWFNPDTYTRELLARTSLSLAEANARAWHVGRAMLEDAIAGRRNHAFETTLGASTIPSLLIEASATHDVYVWYCGLASVDLHLQRVAARVRGGGHDIPESKIRERWHASRRNLIRLMPHLAHLQVFDNSHESAIGAAVHPPVLLLEMARGELIHPEATDLQQLGLIPEWAAPMVEAAIQLQSPRP